MTVDTTLVSALVFALAYTVNMFYTSVLFHRGLTHRSIRLRKWTRLFLIKTGNWVTGIDPKTWTCMHRLHHYHADTKKDPHSPRHGGFWKLILVQLWSYGKTLDGLVANDPYYTNVVKDLNFPVHWTNRHGLWFLPHLSHVLISVGVGWGFDLWMPALAFLVGMQSHPVQGWAVNAFGHAVGYRNFRTPDNSRNNLAVAWLVMGEGFQNNHHQDPTSARFSVKWWEVDLGFQLCRLAQLFGLVQIPRRRFDESLQSARQRRRFRAAV